MMLLLQIYVIVIVVIHFDILYIHFNKVMQINTKWKYCQLQRNNYEVQITKTLKMRKFAVNF